MHQKNILLPIWPKLPFPSSKQINENYQVFCVPELWGIQEAKKEFFPVELLCKASPIWVACSPEEDCSHWVWDTEVFLDAGDIWFSLLMLLLVSSFKIFLWQNYWYLSLVSEVSICKCSDCQEVLSLSGINSSQDEDALKSHSICIHFCIPQWYCSVSYQQKHHFVFQSLLCAVVWMSVGVGLRSLHQLSQKRLMLALGLYDSVFWWTDWSSILISCKFKYLILETSFLS